MSHSILAYDANPSTDVVRVLVVEGDRLYATIIGEMLREGSYPPFEVTLTYSLEEGYDALSTDRFNVVLVDLTLPFSGEGSAVAHLQMADKRIPIIVLTGIQDENRAVEALQAGAQDYLVKGQFKVQSLIRSIRYASERQRLRLALEASFEQRLDVVERQFQELITANADGIVVINEDGIIRYINPGAEAFFGARSTDMLEKDFPYSIAAGETKEIELQQSADRMIYAELRAVAIVWRGNPSLLISLRDTTSRRESEKALEAYATTLQMQNEDLDAYAHTVAHDLKNPLSIMVGFAEVLNQDHRNLPPEMLDTYLRSIARSGRKAEAIINELLLLAGVRNQQIELAPLNMVDLMGEVRVRLEHMIDERQGVLNVPDKWPLALGYGPWVEEVWVNYISNAIKYGGDPPDVTVGAEEPAAGFVRFWVRDNGQGLTEASQSQLFTQFPKISQVRADGHGLGLSIVRRIVTRLGGQVDVKSAIGEGSTFFFSLPAATRVDEPTEEENNRSADAFILPR